MPFSLDFGTCTTVCECPGARHLIVLDGVPGHKGLIGGQRYRCPGHQDDAYQSYASKAGIDSARSTKFGQADGQAKARQMRTRYASFL